ncbi:MAG: caspase family protein [Notoacmeibacter sp.]|nr:caspase family protein [Notoacmeibacter sp.]MCC0031960.1 caspase family protein [Brucellaceae bacterium]
MGYCRNITEPGQAAARAVATRLRPIGPAALMLLTLVAGGPALAGDRIALVIGNGAYQNTSPLPNPPSDAALMAETLEATGFTVTRLTDADQASMKRALLEFGRALRGGDVDAGLFFYAGHGVQVKGENYLVPVNARIDSEDEIDLEGINVNDFLQVMNSANSKINIVILDACRNNPFARSFRAVSRGLAPVDAPKGTLIAYATAPGDVALDGAGNNSPYTLALTQAIRQGQGRTVESVFKATRRDVLAATGDRQVPWETSSVTGDFYFTPGDGKSPAPQPAPSPSAESGMVRKFELARQMDSEAAWGAFLAEYGSDSNNFYVTLAKAALAKLQAAQAPKPAPKPAPAPQPEQRLASLPPPSAGRNQKCTNASRALSGGRLCVSSILDPQFGNRYGGVNLTDGNMATAWVEGVKGDGIGETIVVRYEGPRQLNRLILANGYNKNADIYAKNNRVSTLIIQGASGEKRGFQLSDNGDWQAVDLSWLGETDWFSLSIRSVFSGTKYKDTAISEMRVE